MPRRNRSAVQLAQANLDGSKRAYASHCKHCAECSAARRVRMPHLACDVGWQWEKDIHKFSRELERLSEMTPEQASGQLTLF